MTQPNLNPPELLNLVTVLEKVFPRAGWPAYLARYENILFSLLVGCAVSLLAYFAGRKKDAVPKRLQAAAELFAGLLDDFVCVIIGPKGRAFTPFIGTLFIYILSMNLLGLIPFMKSSTSSWSTTLALALCVFVYVQYTAFRELGFRGYLDHLAGRPRGVMALSILLPLVMFFLHIVSELVRPLSLSLRLRSNIWGDDMLLAVAANFGIGGIPLLFFGALLAIIASVVQAIVFCLLTTIYFAFIMEYTEA
jgi:F-type H+-transporting ATPase subunit a